MISELMNSIFPWKAYAKQPIVSSLSGNIGNWVEGTRRVLRACAVRMIRQAHSLLLVGDTWDFEIIGM